MKLSELEISCRNLGHCPICEAKKEHNGVMCWNCFKYTADCYKYSKLDLEDYLKTKVNYAVCESSGFVAFETIDPEEYEHIKEHGIVIGKYQELQDYQTQIMF